MKFSSEHVIINHKVEAIIPEFYNFYTKTYNSLLKNKFAKKRITYISLLFERGAKPLKRKCKRGNGTKLREIFLKSACNCPG
jgi:hypothetical protein